MTHPELRLLALPSGRQIAIAEYGARDGAPVFFFHGWPSAGTQAGLLNAAAKVRGARLIAIDRPGIGRSSPSAGRRLVDWPALLREIAASLEIRRAHVLGISGGGPYALVSAWGAPELVEGAAVVCGAPPLLEMGRDGLTLAYRILLAVHTRSNWAMRWFFRLLHPIASFSAPRWMLTMLRGALRGPDKAIMDDAEMSQICYDGFRDAWGSHRDGVFEDAEIYAQPWGFPLEEVRRPVFVWHGTEDRNFSYRFAEKVAARLPNCTLRIIPGEGHYSLPILHGGAILEDLLRPQPASAPG